MNKYIAQVINLISDDSQHLWSGDLATARRAVLDADPAAVLAINGSFALVAQDGERVVLARSLERPLRYFLAKATEGPVLVVAERIDEIRAELERRGWNDQFHPSYTRMAPAHHVTTLRLIGCPDPNPSYQRFFDPPRGTLPPDLDAIGRQYVGALYNELVGWLAAQDRTAPIGVPFSGGTDSGSVLLCLNKVLLDQGHERGPVEVPGRHGRDVRGDVAAGEVVVHLVARQGGDAGDRNGEWWRRGLGQVPQ